MLVEKRTWCDNLDEEKRFLLLNIMNKNKSEHDIDLG